MIDWNKTYGSGVDFRAISQRDIDTFLKYIPSMSKKNRSLDVGCGTGQLTRELWHRGFAPTGIDISETAIALAKSYTLLEGTEIIYKIFDLETQHASDFTNSTFELITCKLVYAFINDKVTFLRNVASLLDKNGIFVILTPLLDQVPKEKKHIAVDYDKTMTELTRFFNVETKKDDIQGLFICQPI
jgi:2-polyprenyl-3-methyl-5-hydroxy-6-metoxy-1,4-benzoquinol methylase